MLDWLAAVLSVPGPVTLLDANLSKELLDSAREVDILWRVEAAGSVFLLHLEFQLKRDEPGRPEMGERLAGYIMRLYEREHLPITSIVIYLQRMRQLPRPPFLIPGGLSGSDRVTLAPCNPDDLGVGDIVLVRVQGHIYLHLIKAIDRGRFLIGNNRGGINGWVGPNGIYGKATQVEPF